MPKLLASATGTDGVTYWYTPGGSGLTYWEEVGQDFVPVNSGTQDIGSTSRRVATIYAETARATAGNVTATLVPGSIAVGKNFSGTVAATLSTTGGGLFVGNSTKDGYNLTNETTQASRGGWASGPFVNTPYGGAFGQAPLKYNNYASNLDITGLGSHANTTHGIYDLNCRGTLFSTTADNNSESGDVTILYGGACIGTISSIGGTTTIINDGGAFIGALRGGTDVTLSGKGSLRVGYTATFGSSAVTISGHGSASFGGDRTTADRIVSGKGTFLFGFGTASRNYCFQVGSSFRILTSGAGSANGDIWGAGGNVYVFSGGAARNCSAIP